MGILLHLHEQVGSPIEGRRVGQNEVLEPTDFYPDTSGNWLPTPDAGMPLAESRYATLVHIRPSQRELERRLPPRLREWCALHAEGGGGPASFPLPVGANLQNPPDC